MRLQEAIVQIKTENISIREAEQWSACSHDSKENKIGEFLTPRMDPPVIISLSSIF